MTMTITLFTLIYMVKQDHLHRRFGLSGFIRQGPYIGGGDLPKVQSRCCPHEIYHEIYHRIWDLGSFSHRPCANMDPTFALYHYICASTFLGTLEYACNLYPQSALMLLNFLLNQVDILYHAHILVILIYQRAFMFQFTQFRGLSAFR